MEEQTFFDDYYGGESEQFAFYRIPRQLVTGSYFKNLSTDAKLLYGLLLDRMSLSMKNGWYDEQGRVYIYYPLDEIQEALCCSHGKAVRLFAELITDKGVGLIERIRQGQGKPARIYVKQFTTRAVPPPPPAGTSQNGTENGSYMSPLESVQFYTTLVRRQMRQRPWIVFMEVYGVLLVYALGFSGTGCALSPPRIWTTPGPSPPASSYTLARLRPA